MFTDGVWVKTSEILEVVLDELVNFVLAAEADPCGHSIEFWCFHGSMQVRKHKSEPIKPVVSRKKT